VRYLHCLKLPRHGRILIILFHCFLSLQQSAWSQLSTVPRDDFWITDGEVNALLVTNGLVYIGGNFQNVGPQRAFGVEVNGNSGVADFSSPRIDGPVTAVTPDGSGGWLIARTVFGTDGIGRSRLMRVRADKSVDPTWDVSSGAIVNALLATIESMLGEDSAASRDLRVGTWPLWTWRRPNLCNGIRVSGETVST